MRLPYVRLKRNWRETLIVWLYGMVALVACLSAAVYTQTVLDRLTFLVFDVYQRVQPRPETGAPIVLVDIDETSINALGQWPWPRTVLADMVNRLNEMGAAVIAFDMVFPEPDRTSLDRVAEDLKRAGVTIQVPPGAQANNDIVFRDAIAAANVVTGIAITDESDGGLPKPKAGFAFGGEDPRTFLAGRRGGLGNLQMLDDATKGIGFFSFPPSPDGIIREIPVITRVGDALYPALSIEALRVAQGASGFILRTASASGDDSAGQQALTAVKAGDFELATGPQGEFWIYYSTLPDLMTIPAAKLLQPLPDASLTERLNGAIVIVGTSAIGLRDIVATPVAASMPGMRVHAEILDQIIGGTFLSRPDWAKGAEVALAFTLGVLLIIFVRGAGALTGAAIAIFFIAAAAATSWYAFSTWRILLDPILPAAAVGSVFSVTMPVLLLLTSREKKFVRSAFSLYLAPSLVERLAEDPSMLSLGGELRELTVLFCDIRSFTSLSEKLDPQALTTLLNNFLTPMSDVLLKSEATIDKYMGDAIMAFWNAPMEIMDHRRRSCLAALKMLQALDTLNRQRGYNLRVGIGLNTGDCCVGNLGSSQRFSYSAIGDGVNVASRIEGLCKEYSLPVLLSETVAEGAEDLAILPVDMVQVTGREVPVTLFTILGDADVAARSTFHLLHAAHTRFLSAYRAADFDRARAALEQAMGLGEESLKQLHELYAKRLSALESDGVPEGWNGVFVALHK
ncbi:adenylate cyclase [Pararhizobium capsulatum DSM 1112]|uniref:Adenylate cyclase n=1 Tax=Pararhizobium capsulatum DSM 1112 TaxID=1121113 RepID=A0ABU0BWI4_9HYPH|nr:adenylate/guanylate cyclase domain-containing protein [Pararhizobium capsulatum]MDQ0322618.1 adenylate cyclase [Pararhizobium capsulatum DSM 1112]